jgi:hypothetical protein
MDFSSFSLVVPSQKLFLTAFIKPIWLLLITALYHFIPASYNILRLRVKLFFFFNSEIVR